MKYFKFHQVDSETDVSVEIEPSLNGPTHPQIEGRKVLFEYNGFFYALVSDNAVENKDNYIFELTEEEFLIDATDKIGQIKYNYSVSLYESEISLREKIFGKYHQTASTAGIYKYEEAKNFLENSVESTVINLEAQMRGLTSTEMSQKIIQNHEYFRENDAKISGLRGKILDRIESFVLDETNPADSIIEFQYKPEIIHTKEAVADGLIPEQVVINYYSGELETRWEYL